MTKNQAPEGMTLVKSESIEALADNIAAVAIAARRMDERLNREAIAVLVQKSMPFDMGLVKINAVIDALQHLDKRYLKPKKVKP